MNRTALNRERFSKGAFKQVSGWFTRERALGLGRQALAAGLMLLLARARLLGDLSPFAVALFSAGVAARWPVPAMLLGCLAGSRVWEGQLPQLLAPIGCLIAYGVWLAARLFQTTFEMSAPRRRGERLGGQDALAAGAAMLGALVPGLMTAYGLSYNVMMCVVCALIAGLLAPTLISALSLKPQRLRLMPDEQLSLALLSCLCLLGLRGLPGWGAGLPQMAAVLATLLAAGRGVGLGATAGVLMGAVLSLNGSDPFLGAALSLCGVLAGAVRRLGRPASALAFAAGNALSAMYGLGYAQGVLPGLELILGCAVYLLLPAKAVKRLWSWMESASTGRCDPETLARRMRGAAAQQVERVEQVFDELAAGYRDKSPLPEESELIAAMRRELCAGCAGYEDCWGGANVKPGRMLCQLLGATLEGDQVSLTAELPPEVSRVCRRAQQIPKRLGGLLAGFNEQRRAERQRGESKALVASQFQQAGRILSQAAEALQRPVLLSGELARLAAAALEKEGLAVSELMALDGESVEIVAVLKQGRWDRQAALRAANRLSGELGMNLAPDWGAEGEQGAARELRIAQVPYLAVQLGTAAKSKRSDAPSGDCHLARTLPGGRMVLALSDGMGSGERAQQESRSTIVLLEKFLAAGVERKLALETINTLLLLRSGEDMFATVDLCVLDLGEGTAEFNKLGACSSYVVRRGECLRMQGGRLPLGILEQVRPTSSVMKLMEGDLVVMVSDGVADSTQADQEAWLEEQLKRVERRPPQQVADYLVQAAQRRQQGKESDDMTALVARVRSRAS